MTEILTPHEIVTSLYDSGLIDKGTAHRLEQRINAWTDREKAESRNDGIAEAARKAKFVVGGIKSAGARAAAEKVLRAVERLLPREPDPAKKETYARGYQDGAADERRKLRGDKPHAKQPKDRRS